SCARPQSTDHRFARERPAEAPDGPGITPRRTAGFSVVPHREDELFPRCSRIDPADLPDHWPLVPIPRRSISGDLRVTCASQANSFLSFSKQRARVGPMLASGILITSAIWDELGS